MLQEHHAPRPRFFLRALHGLAAFALLAAATPHVHAAPGDNLALGKPVTMSGGDPADVTQRGANCTDGNTAGAYPANTICRTTGVQTGTNREWIEVDLGQDYVINRVRLFNRTDGTNGDFARWIIVTTRPSTLTGLTSDPFSTLNTATNPSAPYVNKIAYATGNTAGQSYGTGQAAAYTSLDLQVGTHIARYVRIYSMKPAPTALNLAEIQVLEGPPPTRTITNASFELPDTTAITQVSETLVPGWSTTEPVAVPTTGASFVNGGNVEVWNSGSGGVLADAGGQFVELNAFSDAALSPSPLCVYPGETFQWRVSHRARGTAAQVDVAKLRVNGQDVASFSDGTVQAGTHTCAPAPGFTCTAQAGSPTTAGWGRWGGSWTNSSPQALAMTFEFAAISSTGPGSGNFIDDVSITGLAAAVEFSGDASGPEATPTANLPTLLVNGTVATPQTLQLDITGGSAIRGTDYTTTPPTGPITVTIPAGSYDGTAATAISLASYVQVSPDLAIEGNETIVFGISNASAGLSIAGASGCRAGVAAATYTILDFVQPIINVTKTAAPTPFSTGQPAAYTITLANDGNAATAGNITITDTLPAGITLASATGTNWSCTGTTALTCTFTGTIAPGANTVLTLNVDVALAAVGAGGNNSATARGGGDPDCPATGTTAAHCTGTVNVSVISGFVCSPSTIFVAQGAPTQLNAETYGSGSATFTPIGPAVWSYNAIAYRTADNFIYAVSGQLDAAHPLNRLLRVDPGTGIVQNLGIITGALPATGSANVGVFDGAGNYIMAQSSEQRFMRVNLTTRVSTAVALTPAGTIDIADLTFANGFLWGADGGTNPARMIRINPNNGAIARFNIPAAVIPTGVAFGAAWTFGNGNLGFSDNTTGNVYQIRVTNPTATPTFARVSLSPGPTSGQNDGTACITPPIDLAITKTGPASVAPGGAISWTLTVTNNGPVASSGYTVTDTLPAGVTGATSPTPGCTIAGNTVTCVGGTLANGASSVITINANAPNPFTLPLANLAEVEGNETDPVPGNNTATHTVQPPPPANVVITKALAGENGTVAGQAELGEQLTYTITLNNTGGVAANPYVVTDTLDPNVTFVSATNGGAFAAGAVTWAGLNVPAGGTVTLSVTVQVNNPIPDGTSRIGNAAYQTGGPPPNCAAVPLPANCTSIPTVAKVSHEKVAGAPASTGVPNQYRIQYVVTVTNHGGSGGSYNLSDTLAFNGATVNAVSAPAFASTTGDIQSGTLGGFAAPTGGTIVTGETIGALGVETWTYSVTYTIANPAVAADCSTLGGGLRNSAALGGAVTGVPPAATCSGAPDVSILKTAATPVPTGTPNQFTIAYTVNVTNVGTLAGSYNLTDTFAFNGATVNAVSAPAYSSTTGDTQTGALGTFGPPAGGTIVTGENIGIGGAERWIYTVTYTVTNPAVAQDCASPTGGLRNRAELGGAMNGEAASCTGAPAVAVAKAATGPTPTGNLDEYRISYLVTVRNDGTLPGTYNLSDTFTLPGATGVSVSNVVHGGADPLATALGTLTATGGAIVTNETIAAGSSETYAYNVVFTASNPATVGACSASGGLRNRAALGGSSAGFVETCSDVPNIAVTKTATPPVGTGSNNQYTITYTVTVANTGNAAGQYDVSDAFTFAGATVDAVGPVTHGGADPLSTTLGALTPVGGTLVNAEPIAANASETYSYTVTFTVTNAQNANNCTSPSGGLRNQAALGGSVDGSNGTCTGVPVIAVTKALTGESGTQAGIAEPGEQLTYTITLTNTGSVAETSYSVTDNLDPNTTFLSATGGGVYTTGRVSWTGLAVPAGGSTSVTVTVLVNAPIPPGVTQLANVAYQTGTTPPACPSAQCVVVPSAGSVAITKALTAESGTLAGQAEPGEQLTYTITLTNAGGSAALNYAVTDHIDPNTTFVSATNGGTFAAGDISWTGLTVPASGTLQLTVVVSVNTPIPPGVTQIGNVAYQTGGDIPACPPASPQCVVTPTAAQVGIVKALTAESGTQAGVAEGGEQLTYTITLTNTGGSDATNYGVTDRLDPNTTFVSATNGGTFAAGNVAWSGLTVPAQGNVVLTVVVSVNNPLPPGVTQVSNVAYQTGTTPPACPPASPQCVLIPTAGQVTIAKALQSEGGTQAGIAEPGEQLIYTITLTNSGGTAVTGYAVTDGLDPNTTFVSATNGGALTGGEVRWTGLTVPASGNLVLTVVVQVANPIPAGVTSLANVAYQTGTTPPSCPPAGGQCVITPTAAQVTLSKTGGTPVATGTPNQFSITYVATAANQGGSAATYTLTDALTFNGATVNGITPPAYATTTGDTQTGTPGTFGPPSGGTIVTGEGLASLGVETWTYTVTYTVTDPALAANCANPAGGLRNSAAVTGGPTAATCSGAANVNIVKTAAAPVPTGTPNQFSIGYTVEVNNTGTLAGSYDLTDVLTFNGATVNTISAPAYASPSGDTQTGTLGAFTAPNGGTVVTGEPLAVDGTEIWTYTVTYTITNPATAQDCANPAGGLRNSAALGGAFNGQSNSCTGAPAVVIGKSASGPAPTGTLNQYTITYLVNVQNNGTLPGTYNLADAFTLPGTTGVTVSPVSHAGSDPLATTLGTLTAAGGNIVTNETIAAGSNENYTYTVTFTVADPAAVGSCSASGGLRNQAALGGSSAGQVNTCSDVPNVVIAKSSVAPVPTGTPNQFSIAYTVNVTNSGGAAGQYSLADTFAFNGATVNAVSAVTHGGTDPLATTLGTLTAAGGTLVTNEPIAAAGAESYTYTVTYTVNDPALAANCGTPGGGLRNTAALGGSVNGSASTCAGAANVAIVKTANAPVPTGTPNQFALTYTVNVHNAGTIAGSYGLSDALVFNGATINAISAPAYSSSTGDTQTGTLGGFGLPAGGTIVTNEPLAAAGSETWTYTVTYTVTDPAVAQNCANPAGGLRNRAEFGGTFNGESATCTGAAAVVIGKSADGPNPTGTPNQYTIAYLVNVQNNGTLAGTYDLADTFTFPGATGVTVSAVTHGGGDPLATTLGTLTAPGGAIVTNETIAAGASETYAYTVTFTVASATGVGTCSATGGLRNQATLGGSSSGEVNTCSDVPNVTIAKTGTTPLPTGTPNQFRVRYTVDVANTGAAAGTYDLADTFAFNGATVNAVGGVAHGGPDPLATALGTLTAAGGTIVNDETIAAGSSESYTYIVTYTVNDPVVAADCASPTGGLRNSAALGGTATGTAATCFGAANVSVVKSASTPVPTGTPNQFTVFYTVNVVNAGSIAGSYDLSDVLTFNGATVNLVTPPLFNSPSGQTQTGTLGTFGAAGGTIVTGEPIGAGGFERWTYGVTYTVTDPATAQNCASPTGGLRNRAAFGGTFSGQGTTCTGAPAVAIGKSAIGPTPTGTANQYAITYIVEAHNSGTLAGTYDLTDAFTFPGTTGVTVSAVTHAGSDPLAATLGTLTATGGTIVTGETIAAGASETYTYTVTFTVADAAAAGSCATTGGLRNTAALGGSSSGQVSTCSGVPNVTVAKTAGTIIPTGVANQYSIAYTITATNTGGTQGAYNLADTFAFNGATVNTVGAVTHGGTDPLATTLGTLNAAGGTIVTGETIAAGGSESYTYTVTFTVIDAALAGDCTAPTGGLRNSAALGGSATGTSPTCTAAPNVTITKALTGESGAQVGLAEPGETLTYTITLTNTGGSAAANYRVTDPLDPNVVFVSASNGGALAGGAVTWTGISIAPGASVTLTVTVTVASPLPTTVTQIANVAYQTGTTPPDCTAIPAPANCTSIPTYLVPRLSILKTADRGNVLPGGTLVYTITVSNVGTGDAVNATIEDPIPAGIATFAWTCAASGGAVCPNAGGNGAIAETIAVFPVGGTIVYTVTATVVATNPPPTIANTASTTPPGTGLCAPSNTAPPCQASTSTSTGNAQPPLPVPATRWWALMLIGLGLIMLGWRARATRLAIKL